MGPPEWVLVFRSAGRRAPSYPWRLNQCGCRPSGLPDSPECDRPHVLRSAGRKTVEGVSCMKRKMSILTCILLVSAILCGCSGEAEMRTCYRCGDQVDRWIEFGDSDVICAKCFADGGFQVCRKCWASYDKYCDAYDGYCPDCSETQTWYCSVCEQRLDVDHLADFGNGYFLCGRCLLNSIDVPDEMADDLAVFSGFISRNEYLEGIVD